MLLNVASLSPIAGDMDDLEVSVSTKRTQLKIWRDGCGSRATVWPLLWSIKEHSNCTIVIALPDSIVRFFQTA